MYIKGTSDFGLDFERIKIERDLCVGYVDSDYTDDIDIRRSMTSCVLTLAGAPTCWKFIFQSAVALLTTKEEYMSITKVVK